MALLVTLHFILFERASRRAIAGLEVYFAAHAQSHDDDGHALLGSRLRYFTDIGKEPTEKSMRQARRAGC